MCTCFQWLPEHFPLESRTSTRITMSFFKNFQHCKNCKWSHWELCVKYLGSWVILKMTIRREGETNQPTNKQNQQPFHSLQMLQNEKIILFLMSLCLCFSFINRKIFQKKYEPKFINIPVKSSVHLIISTVEKREIKTVSTKAESGEHVVLHHTIFVDKIWITDHWVTSHTICTEKSWIQQQYLT